MKRIFPAYAYSGGPRAGCWWDQTCEIPEYRSLRSDMRCDVAVIGAGFTGLSAAMHLAQNGASVVVLEAERIGWGASGRNGGFCCLGGGKISDAKLDRKYGRAVRRDWRRAEKQAVDLVDHLVQVLELDVDRHSHGETLLAHRARDVASLQSEIDDIKENYGVAAQFHTADQLCDLGMRASFHAGLTLPVGFGLNPRKYLAGLAKAAVAAGARIFEHSPVERISAGEVGTRFTRVRADRIVVATNGYSSEDIPEWMAGRYLPSQSSVFVTRPLTQGELSEQGWTSDQMAYDTRNLLHYFRLLPDRRFLFGKRGGLTSSHRSDVRSMASAVRDFRAMFPAWENVEATHSWSGMVCLARNRVPFVGEVDGLPGVLAGFAFHGNGVAMGTYAGKMLAELAMGNLPELYPAPMRDPARRFPLGRLRRAIMPPLYALLYVRDAGN